MKTYSTKNGGSKSVRTAETKNSGSKSMRTADIMEYERLNKPNSQSEDAYRFAAQMNAEYMEATGTYTESAQEAFESFLSDREAMAGYEAFLDDLNAQLDHEEAGLKVIGRNVSDIGNETA